MSLIRSFVSSLAVVLGFIFGMNSAAQAVTVGWTGSNNFNDAEITFSPFLANQLTDIFGDGQYEGRQQGKTTAFTLGLKLNGIWTTVYSWSVTGDDENRRSLGSRVPPAIDFAAAMVSGIRLTSNKDGEYGDPNFTNFFLAYIDDCDDEYIIKKITKFVFDYKDPAPDPTPLPAALPLMATALMGGYLVARRRKRPAASPSGD